MIAVCVVTGLVAFGVAFSIWAPASRELMIKMGTLYDWARRENPALFAERLAPITPFVTVGERKQFKLDRLTAVLRADLSGFGETCVRLQGDAKRLDRKAHIGVLPVAVYLVGLGLWFYLRRS